MSGKSGADRQRLRRSRERHGLIVLQLEVPHAALTDALVIAGLLPEELIDNRRAVARALEDVLLEWASRVTGIPD